MPVRWTLHDPLTDETITFPCNPREGGLPALEKKATATASTQGNPVVWQGRDVVPTVDFSGVIISEEHLTFMIAWYETERILVLTDHLGRVSRVWLTKFVPVPRNRHNNPWSATYTATYMFFGWGPD